MLIVFGFNDGNGDIWLVVENLIRSFAFSTTGEVAFDIDTTIRESDFFSDLGKRIPASLFQGWLNILCADVSF